MPLKSSSWRHSFSGGCAVSVVTRGSPSWWLSRAGGRRVSAETMGFLALIFLAALAGLVAVWFAATYLEFAGAALLISIVIPVPLLEFGGRIFFAHELILLIVFCAWLLGVAQGRISLSALKHTESLTVLFFGLVYVVSFLRAPDWNITYGQYSGIKEVYRIALSIVAFFVFSTIFPSDRRCLHAIKAMTLAGLLLATAGIYLSVTTGLTFGFGSSLSVFGGEYLARDNAVWSVLAIMGYRVVSGALACAAFGLFIAVPSGRGKTMLTVLLITIQQVVFIGDRGAWLAVGLVFLLIFLFLISYRKGRLMRTRASHVILAAGTGIGLLGVLALFSPAQSETPFLQVLASIFAPDDPSRTNRFLLWERSVEEITSHPVLGIGPGQFSIRYLDIVGEQGRYMLGATSRAVHNLFLDTALAAGLLGLLFFLKIAWDGLRHGVYAIKKSNRESRQIACWAIALVLYFLLKGLTDVPLSSVFTSMLFFSALGIVNGTFYRGVGRIPERPRHERMSPRPI